MNNKMIGRCENCDQDYCQECSENGNWMTNCGDGVPEDSVRKMAQRACRAAAIFEEEFRDFKDDFYQLR